MLARRIIACLDVRDGKVVKGINFSDLRTAGSPVELAARYDAEGIDEVVVLDVTATLDSRLAMRKTVATIASQLFIPLTVGGGIRSADDAHALMGEGADKISINSAAVRTPQLVTDLAARYGSQAVVVAIDARQRSRALARQYDVLTRSGTTVEPIDAVTWAREAADRGAGEILLTSVDRDGTGLGFDCDLTAAVSDAVPIPVIASGGAGRPSHFADVFTRGRADAALAASIFHYKQHQVRDLKRFLADQGIPVRPLA